ncbi:MAG: aminotransferase class I/II-fold pyridoxal phosphate-dependent enzyme [Myxococcota bacterium]
MADDAQRHGDATSGKGSLRASPRPRTAAIHGGEPGAHERIDGAVAAPLVTSSTFDLGDPETFDDIKYIRLNNTPNQRWVCEKLAALDAAEAAVVLPSGTAAIWMALVTSLEAGDEILAPFRVYGGTRKILDELARSHGVTVTYVDLLDPTTWKASERTRVFYAESLTNPWIDVPPLDEVVAFSRQRGLVSIVDNTFGTPIAYRPVEAGFDLVVHSASKYLNGHTDVVAGAIAGDAERIERIRKRMNLMGICLDPHACHLLHRGLKTLSVRVEAQFASARRLAEMLAAHADVESVRHPSLASDPAHANASRLFEGYGAMLSFTPKGDPERARALVEALELAVEAPSLGGLETLVTRPITTSHAGLPASVQAAMGIDPRMIRVSVGLEDVRDLVADFERALAESARLAAAAAE